MLGASLFGAHERMTDALQQVAQIAWSEYAGAFFASPLARLPLWFLALMFFAWSWYLALTQLKRARDDGTLSRLAPIVKGAAYLLLFLFLIVDAAFNLVACFVFFRTYPRDILFTASCERYLHEISARGANARWLCSNMLDPFDPSGKHCRARRP
jgi:hypothetical protein